jgi:hypothetical protein
MVLAIASIFGAAFIPPISESEVPPSVDIRKETGITQLFPRHRM